MKVIEQLLIQTGISPIAGVDEAGRGACAGPLVIAAVVLKDPFAPELAPVRDSKEISEGKREEVFELIESIASSISVVIVSAQEVDARGVHAANLDGMRRAVNGTAIKEPYIFAGNKASEMNFDVTVPKGKVWVMGDHRNASADSRYHQDDINKGFVPLSRITGRVVAVIWPLKHITYVPQINVLK